MKKKITKYKEIESFLFRQLPMFQRVGPKAFKKDLSNIKFLDKYLEHPHTSFKSIHVAGTNGKGSTSFFIATALAAAGYKVGLYTSPHYKDYRERIKVDGEMISKSYVKKFVNTLIADKLFESKLKPSFFELTVAMAFSYFKDQDVDFAIIETGLGGRLDSTNIIMPILSVITNIGFDHTQFLGNTLPLIAKEKAGIIKQKIPVIVGRRQEETHNVFRKKVEAKKSKFTYASSVKNPKNWDALTSNFPDYQKENLSTAWASIKSIVPLYKTSLLKSAWKKGLKNWGYVGRFMELSRSPRIIADSAHNRDGIMVLFEAIASKSFKRLHIVMAVVNDKDLNSIVDLLPIDASFYISQAKIPRAMPKEELAYFLEEVGMELKTYSSIRKALAAAKVKYRKGDLILICGSIFTVAEVV